MALDQAGWFQSIHQALAVLHTWRKGTSLAGAVRIQEHTLSVRRVPHTEKTLRKRVMPDTARMTATVLFRGNRKMSAPSQAWRVTRVLSVYNQTSASHLVTTRLPLQLVTDLPFPGPRRRRWPGPWGTASPTTWQQEQDACTRHARSELSTSPRWDGRCHENEAHSKPATDPTFTDNPQYRTLRKAQSPNHPLLVS